MARPRAPQGAFPVRGQQGFFNGSEELLARHSGGLWPAGSTRAAYQSCGGNDIPYFGLLSTAGT